MVWLLDGEKILKISLLILLRVHKRDGHTEGQTGCSCIASCGKKWHFCEGIEIQGGRKNGLFLRSDNFATTDDRKTCNISKVTEFCLE